MDEKDILTENHKKKEKRPFRKLLPILILAVSAAAAVILTVLCVSWFKEGFIKDHARVIASVSVSLELIYVAVTAFFMIRKSETVYKLLLTGLVLAAVILAVFFIFQATGLLERINSVEELRELIASTGVWAPLIYIIFQFLQVVVLPIPGTLTVGAGVLLFGPLKTSLFSFIGIFIGSLVAFWIGRVLGYKAAAWLVGKDSLDKWLHKIKGKDKVVLSAMFLLPIFPDDVLCFVAGLTSMSWRFFIVLQVIARTISVFATSYSLNGSIIPFNTWWGILIWCLIAVAIIALFILLFKKGEKIEKWFFGLFKRGDKRAKQEGVAVTESEAQKDCAAINKEKASDDRADEKKEHKKDGSL